MTPIFFFLQEDNDSARILFTSKDAKKRFYAFLKAWPK